MFLQKKVTSFLCLFLGLLLLANNVNAAKLSASVDRTSISINDTLLLTVILDPQSTNTVDFSVLESQFDILQRQQNSQASIVNGSVSSQVQWTLVLAPKKTGDLIIPSLSSNGVFSDAIKIQVNDANSTNNKSASNKDELFLTATIDKNNVYVQEQVLLNMRLHYRVNLSGYTPEELRINNSTVELTAENNRKATLNGITYNVLERIYAIHPQASGSITIPAQRWQLQKSSNFFGHNQNPIIRVSSQAHTINVKPIASNSTAAHWLPATSLTLNQEWLQSTITAKVGEPLSYRLTINAEGLSHSQLPSISLDNVDSNAFTIYSDKAETDNQISNNGITGKRVLNYAVIPKTTGSYSLPPISLKWWNTNTDKEETITLKSQKIIVAGSTLGQQNTISPATNIPTATTITQGISDNSSSDNSNNNASTWLWQLGTLLFALLSAVFFYFWTKEKHHKNINPSKKEATDNAINNTKNRPINTIYKGIEQTIEQQQWQMLKTLVLEWASTKKQHPVNNSSELTSLFPELTQTMKMLDKQLYSPKVVVSNFEELPDLLKQQKIPKVQRSIDTDLKSLYR